MSPVDNNLLLVTVALSMGKNTAQLGPALAQRALEVIKTASADEVDIIVDDFKKLASTAAGLKSNAEICEWATERIGAKYRIGDVLDNAMQKDEIRLSGSVMSVPATYIGNQKKSLVEQTLSTYKKALNNGSSRKSAIRIIRALHLPDQLAFDEAAIRDHAKQLSETVLEAAGGSLAKQLGEMIGNGKITDEAEREKLVSAVVISAKDSAVKYLNSVIDTKPLVLVKDAVDKVKEFPDVLERGDAVESLEAGAAVIEAVAEAVGNDDFKNTARQISSLARGGAAICQACTMLAAASTGWGALLATKSLIDGMGGLGVLGGQDANANAQVLSKLDEMFDYMRQEFHVVNQKLDAALTILGELRRRLVDIADQLDEISEQVSQVDRKLDYTLAAIDRMHADIISTFQDQNTKNYIDLARAGLAGVNEITVLQGFSHFVYLAERSASLGGAQTNFDNLDRARQLVAEAFPASKAMSNSDRHWRAMTALSAILNKDYTFNLPKDVAHPYKVKAAIDGYVLMAEAFPHVLQNISADLRSDQKAALELSLHHYTEFIDDLRGPVAESREKAHSSKIYSLVEKYQLQVAKITEAWRAMEANLLQSEITALANGASATRLPPIAHCDNRTPGSNWDPSIMFGPNSPIVGLRYWPDVTLPGIFSIKLPQAHLDPNTGLPVSICIDNWNQKIVNINRVNGTFIYDQVTRDFSISYTVRLLGKDVASTSFTLNGIKTATQTISPPFNPGPAEDAAVFLRIISYESGNPTLWVEPTNPYPAKALTDHILATVRNHVQQAELIHRSDIEKRRLYVNRVMAKAWQEGSNFWKQHGGEGLDEAFTEIGNIMTALRATLAIAYPQGYNQCDVLQGLLEGDVRSRLVDREFFEEWSAHAAKHIVEEAPPVNAEGLEWKTFPEYSLDDRAPMDRFIHSVKTSGNPDWPSQLDPATEATVRTSALQEAILSLKMAQQREGHLFGLMVSKKRLERLPW